MEDSGSISVLSEGGAVVNVYGSIVVSYQWCGTAL